MCQPAPVATRCWADASRKWGSRVTFLGIIGDQAHQTRRSSHNCAPMQESAVNGVAYHPSYAHALDIGHGGNRGLATEIRDALLADRRTRYVIDNGRGYYPKHRGGGSFASAGHTTHVHVSFMPGTHHDTSPFFGNVRKPMTPEVRRKLEALARQAAEGRQTLRLTFPKRMTSRDVHEARYALGMKRGRYGRRVARRVKAFQRWMGLPVTGEVDKATWPKLMFFYFARAWGYT